MDSKLGFRKERSTHGYCLRGERTRWRTGSFEDAGQRRKQGPEKALGTRGGLVLCKSGSFERSFESGKAHPIQERIFYNPTRRQQVIILDLLK